MENVVMLPYWVMALCYGQNSEFFEYNRSLVKPFFKKSPIKFFLNFFFYFVKKFFKICFSFYSVIFCIWHSFLNIIGFLESKDNILDIKLFQRMVASFEEVKRL